MPDRSAAASVDAWARATQDRLRAVLVEAAQDVAENVSVGGAHAPGTPVDTGFARSKWGATLSEPPTSPESPPTGLTEGELLSAGDEAALGMNLVCASADVTDTITLYNNTEYLPYLEDGSTQPKDTSFASGWIAQTRHAWPTIVRLAVQRVKATLGTR